MPSRSTWRRSGQRIERLLGIFTLKRGAAAAFGASLIAAAKWRAQAADVLPCSRLHPVIWAAARVNLSGGNPYDWHTLLAAERQAEPALPTPVMMWNPPWTLSLTTLPSLFPYESSRILWITLSCVVLSGSSVYLWHYWAGSARRIPMIPVLAIAYPASFFAIVMGQVSPFLLLGVVGFLYFEQRRQLFWAGAALSLTLVKPQVAYLLWAAVLVWSLHGRRWQMLAGASAAVGAMCVVPLSANPHVLFQYVRAVLN